MRDDEVTSREQRLESMRKATTVEGKPSRDPIQEAFVRGRQSRNPHTNKILTVLVLLVLVALNPTKNDHRDAIFSKLTANVFDSTDNSITDLAAEALAAPLMARQMEARMERDATYVWLGVRSITVWDIRGGQRLASIGIAKQVSVLMDQSGKLGL